MIDVETRQSLAFWISLGSLWSGIWRDDLSALHLGYPVCACLLVTCVQSLAASVNMDLGESSRKSKYLCPHCDCYLIKKTFNRHQELYFDQESNRWMCDNEEIDDTELQLQPEACAEGEMLDTDQEPPIVGFSSADEISGDAQAPELGVFTAW